MNSVMVARKDKKKIVKEHLIALEAYCRSVAGPMETDGHLPELGFAEQGMRRWGKLVGRVSEEGFRKYWDEFKKTAGSQGVMSPYEV